MRRFVLALLAAAVPIAAAAETRPVALVVTGAEGAFVPDIRAEEVRVLENGEARELVSFEKDDRPLAVVLVMDTSSGAATVFRVHAFDAVSAFVARLPAGSKCTLWTTGDHPRKVGDLEGDRPKVEKRVAQGFGLEGTNTLLDTLVDAAESLGREAGRRRALVAVSGAGGRPHEPLSRRRDLTGAQGGRARARRHVPRGRERHDGLAHGPRHPPGHAQPHDRAGGRRRADPIRPRAGHGGRFESVPTVIGVSRIMESLGAELGGQYRLRYAAAEGKGPRRIEVRLARQGVRWSVAVDSP